MAAGLIQFHAVEYWTPVGCRWEPCQSKLPKLYSLSLAETYPSDRCEYLAPVGCCENLFGQNSSTPSSFAGRRGLPVQCHEYCAPFGHCKSPPQLKSISTRLPADAYPSDHHEYWTPVGCCKSLQVKPLSSISVWPPGLTCLMLRILNSHLKLRELSLSSD